MHNYTLYKVGQLLVMKLPLRMTYALASFCSDVHFIFADKDRADTWQNFKTIFPDRPEKELKKLRLAMFRNFAKYLVDFFRFPYINKEYIQRNVKFENIEYVQEALAKKKGVIMLTAHIGNWELGGVALAQSGYQPLWAVALPHKTEEVNNFFNSRRESKGIRVIPFGKAARQCFEVLRRGELLALVGDRDFSHDAGAEIDFFGKKTYFPKGPAAFALKTGAMIVPGFATRNPDNSFTLRFEKPREYAKTMSVEDVINDYKKLIEEYIRAYPDQWFMFKKFWIQK